MLLDRFALFSSSRKAQLLRAHFSVTRGQHRARHKRHNRHIRSQESTSESTWKDSQPSHMATRRDQFRGSHRTAGHIRNLHSPTSFFIPLCAMKDCQEILPSAFETASWSRAPFFQFSNSFLLGLALLPLFWGSFQHMLHCLVVNKGLANCSTIAFQASLW